MRHSKIYSALVLIVLVALVVAGALPKPTNGCAVALPEGYKVEVAEESAIIVWDAIQKVEHFIRRAAFQTDAKDFGFLVPTPSQPKLSEANNHLFDILAQFTEPKFVTETKTRYVFEWPWADRIVWKSAPAAASARPDAVHVLEERSVGGYDAAVLLADDGKALAAWLEKHGYATRPDLAEWLKPYIEAGWTLTAFKVSKGDRKDAASTAVQMTFKTDRPFFPYREPADQRKAGSLGKRLLRVYCLAEGRYAGKLGTSGQWPGTTVWADKLGEDLKTFLEQAKLKSDTLPTDGWLTEFEDRASPRPGTDEVYFSPSQEPAVVHRPPIINIVYKDENLFWYTVVGVGALLAVIGGFVVRRKLAK